MGSIVYASVLETKSKKRTTEVVMLEMQEMFRNTQAITSMHSLF